MTTILFATGNNRKFEEARASLSPADGWCLERFDTDTPEIQTDDPIELLTAKARHVRGQTARPFLIDDVSSVLEGTVNFPGALSKQVLHGLGPEALPRVFTDGQKITLTCTLALSYLDELHFFSGSVTGTIRHGERPLGPMPLNSIVWLDNQGLFLGDPGAVTHRAKALTALRTFLEERAAECASEQAVASGDDGKDAARLDRTLSRIVKTVANPTVLEVNSNSDLAKETETFNVIASRGVVLSHLPKWRVVEHLEALTRLSHAGTFLVLDFLAALDNGGFPNAGPKNVFTFDTLSRLMRELGWVPVACDGGDGDRVIVAAFHRPHPDSRYFVTGNSQKLLEMREAINLPHLTGCDFDLPELKDDDVARIAEHKARQAFNLVGRPVVSTDGGIFIDSLGGFPGANSKQAATRLKPEGILKLMKGITDRRGLRRNAVACFDGKTMRTHTEEYPIAIADEPRVSHPSYPLDAILVPLDPRNAAGLTYAEMPPEDRVALTELPALADFIRLNP